MNASDDIVDFALIYLFYGDARPFCDDEDDEFNQGYFGLNRSLADAAKLAATKFSDEDRARLESKWRERSVEVSFAEALAVADIGDGLPEPRPVFAGEGRGNRAASTGRLGDPDGPATLGGLALCYFLLPFRYDDELGGGPLDQKEHEHAFETLADELESLSDESRSELNTAAELWLARIGADDVESDADLMSEQLSASEQDVLQAIFDGNL